MTKFFLFLAEIGYIPDSLVKISAKLNLLHLAIKPIK